MHRAHLHACVSIVLGRPAALAKPRFSQLLKEEPGGSGVLQGQSDTTGWVSLLCFLDENTLKIIVLRTLNTRSTLLTNLQVNNNTVLLTIDRMLNRTRT